LPGSLIFTEFSLTSADFSYTINMLFSFIQILLSKKELIKMLPLLYKGFEKEVRFHENDISAEKTFPRQGSRIQGEDEYSRRKKGFGGKACKRKKETIRIGHRNVTFFSSYSLPGGVNEIFR